MDFFSNINQRMGSLPSTEAQLLAEEKWILKTLALIKKEREAYQKERIELENMRDSIIKNMQNSTQITPQDQDQQNATDPALKVKNEREDEVVPKIDDEATINEQKLDLVVDNVKSEVLNEDQAMSAEENGDDDTSGHSGTIDNLNRNQAMVVEDDDQDDDDQDDEDDSDSIDDMYIDMNMLMNGRSGLSK